MHPQLVSLPPLHRRDQKILISQKLRICYTELTSWPLKIQKSQINLTSPITLWKKTCPSLRPSSKEKTQQQEYFRQAGSTMKQLSKIIQNSGNQLLLTIKLHYKSNQTHAKFSLMILLNFLSGYIVPITQPKLFQNSRSLIVSKSV